MNLLNRAAVATAAALAFTITAGSVVTSAHADPGTLAAAQGQDAAEKKAKFTLKRSAAYSHVGQRGVKVTAVLKKKSAKGKVAFSINGSKARTVKVKKGKAAFRLPKSKAPGVYKVTAKYQGTKKSTKVRVYNSAIQLSGTSFTISKAADSWDLPALTGSVVFKGVAAKKGYVDIYQDGKNKGGSSSPFYCCMASVADNGTFQFSSLTFLGKVQEKKAGTYTYQAFYTDGPAYDDYIYSTKITVTVTS
ncbi:hypothetical protein GHK92_12725 [Nocardioides sp. dk4132]|uniref:hypothetical protein n=1 Tax=unclassified Nocardioides TaxID=2615069 RepID=UPI0012966C47|nr:MULTISPECIES: hypothetical protein [unclassified Nocardioides]MQW76741.1 hypothetical protein [Nocardioides sp. dk4132]QGA06902.1 hypothetical protein GFH29_05495 [Nocardioides sp. dk884]